jgi:hypothetical protein
VVIEKHNPTLLHMIWILYRLFSLPARYYIHPRGKAKKKRDLQCRHPSRSSIQSAVLVQHCSPIVPLRDWPSIMPDCPRPLFPPNPPIIITWCYIMQRSCSLAFGPNRCFAVQCRQAGIALSLLINLFPCAVSVGNKLRI